MGDLLDRLFGLLDDAAEACGVSKVDTIGDAYLCAANLAGDHPGDHAARMARFAAAALRAARATAIDPEDPGRGRVRMRVGLHSGPCTAGVVGRRCPKYTLFGDTINVAARMEQSGAPGRIQCTAFTADLIRAQDPAAVLTRRGPVEVKGKGTMETYWLEPGPDPDDEVDAGGGAAAEASEGAAAARDSGSPRRSAAAADTEAGPAAAGPVPAGGSLAHAGSDLSLGSCCDAEAPWPGRWGAGSTRRVAHAERPDGPGASPA